MDSRQEPIGECYCFHEMRLGCVASQVHLIGHYERVSQFSPKNTSHIWKRLAKSRAEQISPGKVEEHLMDLPGCTNRLPAIMRIRSGFIVGKVVLRAGVRTSSCLGLA